MKINMENTKYKINTFQDLLDAVTNENVDRLSKDLTEFLTIYANIVSVRRHDDYEGTRDKRNTEVIDAGFTWIDDGKDAVHVKFKGEEEYTQVK